MHARMLGGQSIGTIYTPVADTRWPYVPTEDGSLVGDGTAFPLGFTIPEMDRLFLQYKKLLVTGTLPGMVFGTFDVPLLNFPPGENRTNLFSNRYGYYIGSAGIGYALTFYAYNSSGYKYDEKLWPNMEVFYVGDDANPDPDAVVTGAYGTIRPDFDYGVAGTITVNGVSALLYNLGPADDRRNPAGDVEVEATEAW